MHRFKSSINKSLMASATTSRFDLTRPMSLQEVIYPAKPSEMNFSQGVMVENLNQMLKGKHGMSSEELSGNLHRVELLSSCYHLMKYNKWRRQLNSYFDRTQRNKTFFHFESDLHRAQGRVRRLADSYRLSPLQSDFVKELKRQLELADYREVPTETLRRMYKKELVSRDFQITKAQKAYYSVEERVWVSGKVKIGPRNAALLNTDWQNINSDGSVAYQDVVVVSYHLPTNAFELHSYNHIPEDHLIAVMDEVKVQTSWIKWREMWINSVLGREMLIFLSVSIFAGSLSMFIFMFWMKFQFHMNLKIDKERSDAHSNRYGLLFTNRSASGFPLIGALSMRLRERSTKKTLLLYGALLRVSEKYKHFTTAQLTSAANTILYDMEYRKEGPPSLLFDNELQFLNTIGLIRVSKRMEKGGDLYTFVNKTELTAKDSFSQDVLF